MLMDQLLIAASVLATNTARKRYYGIIWSQDHFTVSHLVERDGRVVGWTDGRDDRPGYLGFSHSEHHCRAASAAQWGQGTIYDVFTPRRAYFYQRSDRG
jgi:hypothetical protein